MNLASLKVSLSRLDNKINEQSFKKNEEHSKLEELMSKHFYFLHLNNYRVISELFTEQSTQWFPGP